MPALIRDPGHVAGSVYIQSVVAIRLFWTLSNGKTAFNVLHARYGTAPAFSQAFANSVFTSVAGALNSSNLDTYLDVQTKLAHVGVRNMASQGTPPVGFSEWVSDVTPVSGQAVGGGPMPPQIALVVSLKSGFSGQANRGRVYIPGWNNTADTGNGLAKQEAADAAVDFIQALKDAAFGNSLSLCIAQPARQAYEGRTGVTHPARSSGSQLVNGIVSLNNRWETQRLRAAL